MYCYCDLNKGAYQLQQSVMNTERHPGEKTAHLALPLRWSLVGQANRATAQSACTYDIDSKGARLVSSRAPNLGDLLLLERGRNKAICQVTWVADPTSDLRGQFAVRCVDGRAPWEEELRQAEEQYQPLESEFLNRRHFGRLVNAEQTNRRRRPRFHVEGQAEVIEGVQHASGIVDQISELGARISAGEVLDPGTDFRLTLNLFDVTLALKAQVKNLVNNAGMGVEFQQIRRGDRPLLGYVLSRLRRRPAEDFVEVEVVSDRLAHAAAL
jgi:PilZ domain